MSTACNSTCLLSFLSALLLSATPLLAQEPESATEKAFHDAQQLYHDGKLPEALTAFQQFETQYKLSASVPQAIYLQGWCWAGLHRYQEAIDTFVRLIKADPAAPIIPQAILQEAECFQASKNYPKAIDLYRQFETQYPQHKLMLGAMLGEAWALLRQNDLKASKVVVQRIRSQFPDDTEASVGTLLILGQISTTEKNYDDAEKVYQQLAASHHPRAAQGLYLAGEAMFEARRYTNAIAYYERFLSTSEAVPAVRALIAFRIATCYYDLQSFARARDNFTAYLQQYPTDERTPDGLFRLGRSYFQLSQNTNDPTTVHENLANAVKSYELIRSKFPKSGLVPEVTFQLGYLYAYLGAEGIDRSVTSFQEFVNRWPDNQLVPEALYQIARNEAVRSHFDAAIRAYRRLIDKYPNHDLTPFAAQEIAAVYDAVGNDMLRKEHFSQARDAFQKSLALDPKDPRTTSLARFGFAEACLRLNRLDDAEKAFNQVLTADPQNTAAQLDLAKVYLAQANSSTNAKAVDLLNKIMASSKGENASEAAFLLGNYFFNLRDNEKENKKTALPYYLRVALLTSGPRGEEASFRSGQCHQVLGNTDAARSAFQAYLRRFPAGRFSGNAQQELAVLPASPPQS